jgi:hypothetical protein
MTTSFTILPPNTARAQSERRRRFGFGVARCGLVPLAPLCTFKMIFFIPVTLVTQALSASMSILPIITHSTHCVPQALRWSLLRRGSRVLKRQLPTLGRRKMPALVSTPTTSRAAPGCSLCTNPYYRNRTHRRSYYEEEKLT